MQQMVKKTPRITHCDQCGGELPTAVVEELRKAPRFHACTNCVARGHVVIGLGK